MDLGLRDRVVLVTGGSSGIGQSTAVAFGREGARVALTYHTAQDAAEQTAAEVRKAGGEAIALRLDLADRESAARVLRGTRETWGGLDVLVSNAVDWAARGAWPPDFAAAAPDAWRRSLRVNLEGVFDLTQQTLPLMTASPQPRRVFVSSGTAEHGLPGEEAYAAAKSGLSGLTRCLAREYGPRGVLVNIVMPGLTLTERCRAEMPEDLRDTVARAAATGRLSVPDEVADVIVFLASRANGNITGEIVRVSGGM
jgi:3-oxoacyl-[acyl-carrier protein] reductase